MFSSHKLIKYVTIQKFPLQNCARLLLGLPRNLLASASFNRPTVCNSSSSTNMDEPTKAVELAHKVYSTPYLNSDKVPIIILHGLLDCKTNWGTLARHIMNINDGRMVITLDARNHGDSPHTNEFNYELMVADVMKFLNDKGIRKATFIGHCMGGKTCMLLALKYPYLVQELVVVDMSPVCHNMPKLSKLLDVISSLKIYMYPNVQRAHKVVTSKLLENSMPAEVVSLLMTSLVESDTNSLCRWKFNVNSIRENFESEICTFPSMEATCSAPTLFVAGIKSNFLLEQDEGLIRAMFPKASFHYIHGAGHWVHAETPATFLYALKQFFIVDNDLDEK